MLAVA